MEIRMNIDAKQFLVAIEEEFQKLISEKNSWGKNELLLVMEKAKTNALLRFM
jgi:hypothetical protein